MPKGNFDIIVEIYTDEVISQLKNIEDEINEIVDDEIYNYLIKVRDYARENHRWNRRTGELERAHFIEKIDGGWQLRVSPEGAYWNEEPFNYGYWLEYINSKYAWIQPAIEAFEGDLEIAIDKRIRDIQRSRFYETTHMRGGRPETVLRYSAGTVDKITGEKIGGRFAKRL